MRTKDALMIGFQLGRIQRTLDAWEESKHKRDKDGKFSSTGGGTSKGKNIKYNTSPEKLVENLRKITEIKKGSNKETQKALSDLQAGILREIEKVDWKRSKPSTGGGSSSSGGGSKSDAPTKNQVKNATYALSYAMGKDYPGQIANRLMGEGVPEKAIDPIIDEIVKSRKKRYDHKGRSDGWMLPEEAKKKIINMVAAHMTDED